MIYKHLYMLRNIIHGDCEDILLVLFKLYDVFKLTKYIAS